MTYVITSTCVDVKDGGCVPACPVDCIYEGGRMLYIQPDECIGCGLCESICPVGAIWEDVELDDEGKPFIEVNAEYFADSYFFPYLNLPIIPQTKNPTNVGLDVVKTINLF